MYDLYKIIIERKAQKFLNNLNSIEQEKIVFKIKSLTSSNIDHLNIKKLKGYKNLYRLKVDDYRIIYAPVSHNKILIVSIIGHRKEVYDLVKRMNFNI